MSADGFGGPPPGPALSPTDFVRYGRHISLPVVGESGQRRLKTARVAIVGIGGLGCPAAMYLAAAGIGTLGLIDGDRVETSNLQRQVLFGDGDVGRQKVEVAGERLHRMNLETRIVTFPRRLDASNAFEILRGYDIIVDGSDNFPTKYLLNDAAVLLGVPVVHGSVLRFEGWVSVFATADGPCYRCLYPEPPAPGVVEDCRDAGVLGVMPGLVGVLQATEVLKTLGGFGDTLAGTLLVLDGLGARSRAFRVSRDPQCPACGVRSITHLIDYDAFCAGPVVADIRRLSPAEAAARLPAAPQLIDVRERWEWDVCRLPGATLVPVADLEGRLSEFDPLRETIVYCHRGARSLHAARRLQAAGFGMVAHIEGGIDRYAVEVDAALARY